MNRFAAMTIFGLAAAVASAQEITITSEPAGAMVFIDNEYAGTTPMDRNLPDGEHRIRLRRRGYRDFTLDITAPLAEPSISAKLSSNERGSIVIASKPPGCTVTVNGQESGKTPLTLAGLANDVYDIRVYKPNYSTHSETVEVIDGGEVKLEVRLESRIEQLLRKRIADAPKDLANYSELGHHYLLADDWDAAVEIFKAGAKMVGETRAAGQPAIRFYQELSKAYTGQYRFTERSRMDEFRERFAEVMECAIAEGVPANTYYQRVVALYAAMGGADRVMQLAERLNTENPTRKVHNEFGMVYLSRGKSAEAIKMLNRALEIEDSFDTRFALATAYHRRGDLEAARRQYELCLQMKPAGQNRSKLHYEMARLYHRTKEYDRAIESIDEALKILPDDRWQVTKAAILLDAGNCAEARKIVEELLAGATLRLSKSGAEAMLKQIDARCKEAAE